MVTNTPPLYALTPTSETDDLDEGYYHTVGSEYVAYLHKDNVPSPYKPLHGWDTDGLTGYLRPLPEGTVPVSEDHASEFVYWLERCGHIALTSEKTIHDLYKEYLTKLAQMGE